MACTISGCSEPGSEDVLEHFKVWGYHSCLRQPVPVHQCPHSQKLLPNILSKATLCHCKGISSFAISTCPCKKVLCSFKSLFLRDEGVQALGQAVAVLCHCLLTSYRKTPSMESQLLWNFTAFLLLLLSVLCSFFPWDSLQNRITLELLQECIHSMCVLGSRANPVTATVGGYPHFQCGCLKDGCECNCFRCSMEMKKKKNLS